MQVVLRRCYTLDEIEAKRFGMNPVGTAWELTTLSFVIDWFISVGDFIAAYTPTRLNIEELQKKIRDGRSALKDLQGELGAAERSFFSLNGIVTDAIKAFTGLQVIRSITGLLQDAFNASVSFESAFAGVRKTVEGTPEELAHISNRAITTARSCTTATLS